VIANSKQNLEQEIFCNIIIGDIEAVVVTDQNMISYNIIIEDIEAIVVTDQNIIIKHGNMRSIIYLNGNRSKHNKT
jgi:hypothetical protein